MLFQEILNKKHQSLAAQFDQLHQLVAERQTDEADLLLIHVNGFYNPDILDWDNLDEKQSPYVIGPGFEGHSENTHYNFITDYIHNHLTNQTYEEYLKAFKFDENRINETNQLENQEAISIQKEMLIFLKIWESNMFVKKMYQLVLLLNKQPYDWHCKITGYNREPGTTGKRDDIIRKKIRNKCRKDLPILAKSIENTYTSQVRNAIAHSEYAIIGRTIILLNYDKNDPYSQIQSISFDEWAERFHETIILYSCYKKLMKLVNLNYGQIALANGGSIEVRVSRKFPTESIQYLPLYYRDSFQNWGFYPDK